MEFFLLLLVMTTFLFLKKLLQKYPNLFEFPTSYKLKNGYIYDERELSEKQELVMNYLKTHGEASEKELLEACKTNKNTITSLQKKGAIEQMAYRSLKQKDFIILGGLLVLLILSMVLINYFVLVRINLRYIGIFFFIAIFLFIGWNIAFLYIRFSENLFKKVATLAGASFGLFLIMFFVFGGRPFLHAEEYSNLIEINEASFVNDINTVDINSLPIVDKSYGAKLGTLKLGEYPGIGSEFQPGDYSDIIYQGRQYLVAPLEYRGFFKWTSNKDTGTPGYILIDKVTSETKLINLRETTGEGLKFVPSAFFGQDLSRHAYYNGLNKYRLENIFFEIDEEGMPFYVMQYSLPTIFINGGNKIDKIAVVNAIDGEINIYEPSQVPDWVESVYPNSLMFEHLNYWGSLQDGWLNSIFAQRGVLQTSTGTRVVMNEGELFYFTGLTSAGNDESTIGFIYTNMRTYETKLYRFPGATEEAAMNKALTLIPQTNISTSFPIPMNVLNTPTYYILIKGEDGRIIRHVFIKIQDLEFTSISEVSKSDAYNRYITKLNEDDDGLSDNIIGTIDQITSYVVGGNTIYWIEIEDSWYMINVANFTNLEMQYFISKQIGDEIEIAVIDFNVVGFILE